MAAGCDDEAHEFRFAGAEPHRHYCVPVSSRGRVLGVLNVYMAADSPRDPDEEEFLTALANTLALIIERNRAEKDKHRLLAVMARSRRLESVSRLAGGLAHDLNNILTGISGYAMLSLLDLPEDAKARKNLEGITASCRRAADLVRRLATFARQGDVEIREMHLGGFIGGQEKNLARILGPGVRLELESEEGLRPVRADADLLENIVFNLAHNSREAMDAAGTFRLRCRNVDLDEEAAARLPGMRPGAYVLLEAEDTGPGIDPDVADLVFDPFFTTSHQPGRGLGLSTVYGAMKRLGGNVYVEGRPGQGARFRLYFPCAQGAAEKAPGRPAGDGEAPCGRVLLVEDDEGVRDYVSRLLSHSGYRVTACASGAEALEAGTGFDLVLSDIILPEMNGVEVVRELKRRNPGLRALFMSGFLESLDEYADVLVPGRNFVAKPVVPKVLLRAVERALAE
jgi:two-component system cell cycle sensor histidine kinase/response regulator CckA